VIIRRARAGDHDVLLECWLRSVQATHDFVSDEAIAAMVPEVRSYLSSDTAEIWVACDETGAIMGFMGMSGPKMDALFVAPEFQGRGVGRRMVQQAQARHADLAVDVNEQNTAARRFYEACGFVVDGRSELDDRGRPYPLLHLRLATPNRVPQPPAPAKHA
jgi:putative acetyltransferase